MDLYTFLRREAEKSLRSSAGLSAYDGSRSAIPCPGTGPLRRRSPPAPLAAHFGPAVKPSPSSRRKKRRRGAPSCGSAGEEVVSQPAYFRAAESKPASSPATALSARLAAPPPMPSALAPARCSEATPAELEQRLRFYARQIKSLRTTSFLYSSPELMERIRKIEMDYETAVRLFYCHPPSPTPSHMSAAAEQPDMTPDPKSAPAHVTEGPADASASASASEGSPGCTPPGFHRVFGGALLCSVGLHVFGAGPVARLNSVPAGDDLLVARLNSVLVSE
ncbi:hypothetical protein CHARACLAT_013531 [Characodon lateralis]|uniref:Uncharacterized protein n=1 Tax=Characodon lateralis TaxID=208331 RepID=A0ABU7ETF7_9TELE|nr:hypothetical protein [Characodon lateralis]